MIQSDNSFSIGERVKNTHVGNGTVVLIEKVGDSYILYIVWDCLEGDTIRYPITSPWIKRLSPIEQLAECSND